MSTNTITIGTVTDVNVTAMTANFQPSLNILGSPQSPITFSYNLTTQQAVLIDAMQRQLILVVVTNPINQITYAAVPAQNI
jgi:hypothetical protein